MKNKYSISLLVAGAAALFTLLNSCEKDYVAPAPAQSRSFVEDFDTVANLYAKGWVFNNNSRPLGEATWQQGLYAPGKLGGFDGWPAFSYKASADEYVFAGFASVNDGNISSWMITPPIVMRNGDKFSFYTRTFDGSTFADRLQVRLKTTLSTADSPFTANRMQKSWD